MVAKELGARKVRAMHQAAAASSLAGMAIACAMSLAFWLGRDTILAVLTSLEPVTAAAQGLWWAVIALPLVSGASWMLDGIFLGAGRSADMLASMTVSVLAVFVPIVAVTLALGLYGNAWLWLAFLAMNITRAATLAWRYWRLSAAGRWLSAPTQATA
jgi:multidrug resistance protein, MATE family